jgi:hypothetical protein
MGIEVIKVREDTIDIKPENSAIITRSPNKHRTVLLNYTVEADEGIYNIGN